MDVKHSKSFKDLPNYSIEWGDGTWSKDWEEKFCNKKSVQQR